MNIYIAHYRLKKSLMCSMRCVSQYMANRKHLSERLQESKVSISSFRYAGRLFHADGPAQENALLPAVVNLANETAGTGNQTA